MEKIKAESGTVVLSSIRIHAAVTVEGVVKECIVFICYKNSWYKSNHAKECVDVEHEERSLDYWPLMHVVNQRKAKSPLMSMSAKVPGYILRNANKRG